MSLVDKIASTFETTRWSYYEESITPTVFKQSIIDTKTRVFVDKIYNVDTGFVSYKYSDGLSFDEACQLFELFGQTKDKTQRLLIEEMYK